MILSTPPLPKLVDGDLRDLDFDRAVPGLVRGFQDGIPPGLWYHAPPPIRGPAFAVALDVTAPKAYPGLIVSPPDGLLEGPRPPLAPPAVADLGCVSPWLRGVPAEVPLPHLIYLLGRLLLVRPVRPLPCLGPPDPIPGDPRQYRDGRSPRP